MNCNHSRAITTLMIDCLQPVVCSQYPSTVSLFSCLSTYLLICPSVHMWSACVFICSVVFLPSAYLCLHVYLFIRPSLRSAVCPSSTCLSLSAICLYVCTDYRICSVGPAHYLPFSHAAVFLAALLFPSVLRSLPVACHLLPLRLLLSPFSPVLHTQLQLHSLSPDRPTTFYSITAIHDTTRCFTNSQ